MILTLLFIGVLLFSFITLSLVITSTYKLHRSVKKLTQQEANSYYYEEDYE